MINPLVITASITLILSIYLATATCVATPDSMQTPLHKATPEAIRSMLEKADQKALSEPGTEAPLSRRSEIIAKLKKAMAASALLQSPAEASGIRLFATAAPEFMPDGQPGKITYPLYHAKLRSTDSKVYFVLTESSDRQFAEQMGIMFSEALGKVNSGAIEENGELSNDLQWTFIHDPGRVAHADGRGKIVLPESNVKHSPLKAILWRDRRIIVNAPFIKWGDGPGEQLQIDNTQSEDLRIQGGQILQIDLPEQCTDENAPNPCGWVSMKLHRVVHRGDISPYLTFFNASQSMAAEMLGLPYTPKLAQSGYSQISPLVDSSPSSARSAGVSSMVLFSGMVHSKDPKTRDPLPATINYGAQFWSTYSPIVQISWAFPGCQERRCTDDLSMATSNSDGVIYHEQVFDLFDNKILDVTDSPADRPSEAKEFMFPGAQTVSKLLILNAPSPLSVPKNR